MDSTIITGKLISLIFEKDKIKSFENKLMLNESKLFPLKNFIYYCIAEGSVIMLLTGAMVFLIFEKNADLALISMLAGFSIPFLLNYLFEDIKFEKRKSNKEELVPQMLFEASLFCDDTNTIEMLCKISVLELGLIKKDIKNAVTQIQNGENPQKALASIKEMNKSKTYSKAIDLFIYKYKSGEKISMLLKETAEEMIDARAIVMERQAIMLVNKYTLLLASGIIVPAILGTIISLVNGFEFNSFSELGIGLKEEIRKEMISYSIFGTIIYIVEYASISSVFLALQEGKKKNAWRYLAVLLPLSATIFFLAKSFVKS